MSYRPGTHLVATLNVPDPTLVERSASFAAFVLPLLDAHGLQRLGHVFHDFEPAGFTGVVCLSESHLSLHTWPEYGRVNLDIYLSNHQRSNDGTVQALHEAIRAFLGAEVETVQTIIR